MAYSATGEPGFSGDGGPATKAQFNYVMCITLNHTSDTLYVADLKNRRIRALEKWVGVDLVDRSSYPVSLTRAGEQFLRTAEDNVRRLYLGLLASSGPPQAGPKNR